MVKLRSLLEFFLSANAENDWSFEIAGSDYLIYS